MTHTLMVLGAGRMGRGIAWDWLRQPDVGRVVLVDLSPAALADAAQWLTASAREPARLVTTKAELADQAAAEALFRTEQPAVVASAATYRLNAGLARAALAAGCHFLDLGGNSDVVAEELALDAAARAAGVAIMPDCGLAPGLANVLVGLGVRRLERTDAARIRVGGLPQNPEGPLDYALVFSVAGLINEYVMPARLLVDGAIVEVESLTGLEVDGWPEPYGALEAFYTAGTSTLPDTFAGRVKSLDEKTLRYPGHLAKLTLLRDLGLLDDTPEPPTGGHAPVPPRAVLEACLTRNLPPVEDDVVLLRVTVEGTGAGGTPVRHTWQLIAGADPALPATAMLRTTAFPAAIVGLFLARGAIAARGALLQERDVPAERLIAELAARGLAIESTTTGPSAATPVP